MDLKEVEGIDPNTHWYYRSKSEAVLKAISRHTNNPQVVVDIGAGSGFFTKRILETYPDSAGICIDVNYDASTLKSDPRLEFTNQELPRFGDTYLFMDVLEHVEDDLKLLTGYLAPAPAGAIVVITVPAFKSLWSNHDVYLGHFRRYKRKEVDQLAMKTGLEVLESQYIFSTIFPLVWLHRKLIFKKKQGSHMKSTSRITNTLLRTLLKLENQFNGNSRFGLSVLVVAKKPSATPLRARK
jgi:hypothetical protein